MCKWATASPSAKTGANPSPPEATSAGQPEGAGGETATGTKHVDNARDDGGKAAEVQVPAKPAVQASDANVRQLRDQFKAKKFTTLMRRGRLHPIHQQAYGELAKKNGGHSFSVQPAW